MHSLFIEERESVGPWKSLEPNEDGRQGNYLLLCAVDCSVVMINQHTCEQIGC